MNIYIATKFENKKGFDKARKLLEAAGHTITHDWTVEDASKVEESEREQYLAECAVRDLEGVMAAHVVVFLAHPKMAGALVELGFALGQGKPCVLIDTEKKGVQDCIFYHLPDSGLVLKQPSIEAAVQYLTAAEAAAMALMNIVQHADGPTTAGNN